MSEIELGPTRPLVPPLYCSAVYSFPDLDALEAVYRGQVSGFVYARDAHPNAVSLARSLASWESAKWCMVTASGMAALALTLMALLRAGDVVVASRRLYGRTLQLLTEELPRWQVHTYLVDLDDTAALAAALARRPRLVLVETLSNPTLRLADIPRLAQLCHEVGAHLLVDNTFATPVLCQPLRLGADFVVESLTKMLAGHSDVTLGAAFGREDEAWERLRRVCTIFGWTGNPFDCWLAERGLQTLAVRMQQASRTAQALADWLAQHPRIRRVIYPGRPDHPDHDLARRLFSGNYGNMLSIELAGGREAVNQFLRRQDKIVLAPSLGDVRTICTHPASTSHRYAPPEENAREGITDGLLRISVGLEPLEELQEAFRRGLDFADA
ncbi:MAG: PLP-dependent aspartate aminotransferase family protein [Gemmatales bacterium]|nr:PLP-dependent aspartate aminotransferase family protein [Gemmatales bacterium]